MSKASALETLWSPKLKLWKFSQNLYNIVELIRLKGEKKLNPNWQQEPFMDHVYASFLFNCLKSGANIREHITRNLVQQMTWINGVILKRVGLSSAFVY
jgi:hypothetical protein